MAEALKRDEIRAAQKPILDDLERVGLHATSLFSNLSEHPLFAAAIPILLGHLRMGGYPDRVMGGLGIALASKESSGVWHELRDLYVRAKGPQEREGIANALIRSAKKDHVDGLIELIEDQSLGDSRVLFLRTLKRLDKARGLELIASLQADPELGVEATRILQGKGTTQ